MSGGFMRDSVSVGTIPKLLEGYGNLDVSGVFGVEKTAQTQDWIQAVFERNMKGIIGP